MCDNALCQLIFKFMAIAREHEVAGHKATAECPKTDTKPRRFCGRIEAAIKLEICSDFTLNQNFLHFLL